MIMEWGCGRTYSLQGRRLQTWDNSTATRIEFLKWIPMRLMSQVVPLLPSLGIDCYALWDRKVSQSSSQSLSLDAKPFASSLPNPKFSMAPKGAFMARGFPLSLLLPERTDNPRPPPCHPPQAWAGFLSRGSSPCPLWWAEAPKKHPKAKMEVSYLWGVESTGQNQKTSDTQVFKSFCIFFFWCNFFFLESQFLNFFFQKILLNSFWLPWVFCCGLFFVTVCRLLTAVAPLASWYVASSQSTDWTHVPCTGKWILNHRTTRVVFFWPTYWSIYIK